MYKIIRTKYGDIEPCAYCGSQVATCEFDGVCEFCANLTGPKDEPVTRRQLAQMLNVLRTALEVKQGDE